MSGTRWFATPLAGTAAVLAGLGLLAIPLYQLTSARAVPLPPPSGVSAVTPTQGVPAVLRVKLLTAANLLRVETAAGLVLLDAGHLAAGESEHDVAITFDHGGLDLTLVAEFAEGRGDVETAVFLTVMPDGLEDQTRYAIGSGGIRQSLHYDWLTP